TWCVCAACSAVNGLLVLACAERKYEPPPEKATALIAGQVRALFSAKNYLFALAATSLVMIAPGFGTPITYYQQDVLKLSEAQIGTLPMFNGIGGLAMGLACVALASRIPLGRLFFITVVLNAVGTLAYTRYGGFWSAAFIEPVGGFVSAGTTV